MNTILISSSARYARAACLAGSLMISSTLFANQNAVLERFESAGANWDAPVISTQLTDANNAIAPAAALGETLSLTIDSSEPASLLTAVVNTYGDVRLYKSNAVTERVSHQIEVSAPVGQYSVFTFATSPAIPNSELGMPDSATSHQLDIGTQSVEDLLAAIAAASDTHQIAKAAEFMFLVDDTSLAMRGIRKKMKKLKDKNKTPLATVTTAVQTATALVTPKAQSAPATASAGVTATAGVQPQPSPTVEVTEELPLAVAATTGNPTIVNDEVQITEVSTEEDAEPVLLVAALDTNSTPVIDTEVALAEVQLTEVNNIVDTAINETEVSDSDTLSLDIKFALNSDNLTPSGVNALDTLGSALLGFQRAGDLPTIMLEGHTDDTGSEAYNLTLSEKRAESARKYLLERFSLPSDSVLSAGFGETSPKVLEQTKEGRRANRRVELRVVN